MKVPSLFAGLRTVALSVCAVLAAGNAVVAQGTEARAIMLRLVDGVVTGDAVEGTGRRAVVRVEQGETVELHWRSDAATELHLHGYNVAVKAGGGDAVMRFTAAATGRFPVEAHALGDKTVLYLEVHPR